MDLWLFLQFQMVLKMGLSSELYTGFVYSTAQHISNDLK